MTDSGDLNPLKPPENPLDANYTELALTAVRVFLATVMGPAGGAILELMPSSSDRQHERAIRTLQAQMQELHDRDLLDTWEQVLASEELDAALVRAVRAAEEAGSEGKRELIYFGLLNGWVRTSGNPSRERFQRIVAKYDLAHFQILKQMQAMVKESVQWFGFESGLKPLVDTLGRSREELLPYLQEFAADGLVMLYDQPVLRGADRSARVDTTKNVLWKHDSEELLAFVSDPKNMMRGSVAAND